MTYEPTDEQAMILGHDITRHARLLAGPGTGKSSTVAALHRHLSAGPVGPKLKLLTFTRAATAELGQKIEEHAANLRQPSTMHSFAISVLLMNEGSGGFSRATADRGTNGRTKKLSCRLCGIYQTCRCSGSDPY